MRENEVELAKFHSNFAFTTNSELEKTIKKFIITFPVLSKNKMLKERKMIIDTFIIDLIEKVKNDIIWQDEKGFYNSSKGKFIPKDENVAYTDEKIVEINKEIALRQSMSSLAIKNDYFNYLFKGLEKYTIAEEEIESGEINESSNS